MRREALIPKVAYGHAGACGSAVASGIFLSVVTGTTPLSGLEWGAVNMLTDGCLMDLGKIGGPGAATGVPSSRWALRPIS